MSKTWLWSMIITLMFQLLDFLSGNAPAVVEFLVKLSPTWLDPLVISTGPAVIAWLVATLMTLLRNDAVKTGTIASPITGKKETFEGAFRK